MKDVEYLLQGAGYAAERDEWAVFVAERKDEMVAPSTLPVDLVCRPPEATAREVTRQDNCDTCKKVPTRCVSPWLLISGHPSRSNRGVSWSNSVKSRQSGNIRAT